MTSAYSHFALAVTVVGAAAGILSGGAFTCPEPGGGAAGALGIAKSLGNGFAASVRR